MTETPRRKPGRPPRSPEARACQLLALEHSEEAVRRLITFMRGDDPKLAFAAAQTLLDRGLGKPTEHVSIEATIDGAATSLDLSRLSAADSLRLQLIWARALEGAALSADERAEGDRLALAAGAPRLLEVVEVSP